MKARTIGLTFQDQTARSQTVYGYVERLKLICLIAFGVLTSAIFAYQYFWQWPQQRCEAKGAWWDGYTRACGIPIPLYVLTGRKNAAQAYEPVQGSGKAPSAPSQSAP
jgi:hypothetical protein